MGIEPTLVAWEATVLPLNYTRGWRRFYAGIRRASNRWCRSAGRVMVKPIRQGRIAKAAVAIRRVAQPEVENDLRRIGHRRLPGTVNRCDLVARRRFTRARGAAASVRSPLAPVAVGAVRLRRRRPAGLRPGVEQGDEPRPLRSALSFDRLVPTRARTNGGASSTAVLFFRSNSPRELRHDGLATSPASLCCIPGPAGAAASVTGTVSAPIGIRSGMIRRPTAAC